MSSAPLLIDIDDRRQAAQGGGGARASRAGSTCFDRVTGQPIWPIEERPVPQTDDAAARRRRRRSRSRPSRRPYARTYVSRERPDRLHAGAARAGAREPEAVPLGADRRTFRRSVPNVEAARRDQHRQHRAAARTGRARASTPRPASSTRRRATAGVDRRPATTRKSSRRSTPEQQGQPRCRAGKPSRTTAGRVRHRRRSAPRGRRRRSTSPARERPPQARPRASRACRSSSRPTACWRRSTSTSGELLFQVPHGDTPDAIRNHPLLQGHEHPEDRPDRQRRRADHQDAA